MFFFFFCPTSALLISDYSVQAAGRCVACSLSRDWTPQCSLHHQRMYSDGVTGLREINVCVTGSCWKRRFRVFWVFFLEKMLARVVQLFRTNISVWERSKMQNEHIFMNVNIHLILLNYTIYFQLMAAAFRNISIIRSCLQHVNC